MRREKWTQQELNLFNLGLSCKDIALETGRTLKAVYVKQSYLKHAKEEYVDDFIRATPLASKLTQQEKEERLYLLMRKLGLRLAK